MTTPAPHAQVQPPAPDPQPPAPQDSPSLPAEPAPTDPAAPPATDAITIQPAPGERPLGGEPGSAPQTGAGLVAVGLLIAMVMILGMVILAMRKRLFRSETQDAGSSLLDNLRTSLREGTITQEEFDAARRVMIARLKGDLTPEKNARRRG